MINARPIQTGRCSSYRERSHDTQSTPMSAWRETQEAANFIATADDRQTSPELMEAFAFFARNLREAEALWGNLDGALGTICQPIDIWERVTRGGIYDAADFRWGTHMERWWWSHMEEREQCRGLCRLLASLSARREPIVRVDR